MKYIAQAAAGVGLAVLASSVLSCDSEQDRACVEMGAAYIERARTEYDRDYSNFDTETFYSEVVDSCIHIEVARIGVDFQVRDLSRTILRDGGDRTLLLHCDPDGADSVRIDAVRAHGGVVFDVPYKTYLDDGFGGPPRALKKPDQPYTRSDCERVLDKWRSTLRRAVG